MTQAFSSTYRFALVVLSLGLQLCASTYAQSPNDLPPTLRAAQTIHQESGSVIDQLLNSSTPRDRSHSIRASESTNELRGAGRSHDIAPTQFQRARRPSDIRPASNKDVVVPSHLQRNDPVQPAAFERSVNTRSPSTAESDAAWDRILRSSSAAVGESSHTANSEQSEPSFIEKEATNPESQRENTAALIRKISINLMFVLAIAFGFLLLVKHWQKGKFSRKPKADSHNQSLNVSQVLPLTNGASLHVVQGNSNRFLVAIDSSGIKSVKVLTSSFDDTMQQVENRQHRRESASRRQTYERIEPSDVSSEIDEKLIKMLLQNAPAAAA